MPQTKESFLKSRSTKVLITAYQGSNYTYNWHEEHDHIPSSTDQWVTLNDKLNRFSYTKEEIKKELDKRPHLPNKKERQEKLARLKPKKHIDNHSSPARNTNKAFKKDYSITIHEEAENQITYSLINERGQWPFFLRRNRHVQNFSKNINNEQKLTVQAKCSISGTNENNLQITITPDNHSPISSSFISRCRTHFIENKIEIG